MIQSTLHICELHMYRFNPAIKPVVLCLWFLFDRIQSETHGSGGQSRTWASLDLVAMQILNQSPWKLNLKDNVYKMIIRHKYFMFSFIFQITHDFGYLLLHLKTVRSEKGIGGSWVIGVPPWVSGLQVHMKEFIQNLRCPKLKNVRFYLMDLVFSS